MKREFKFRSWIISQKKMIKVFGFNEHLVFEQTWDSPSIKENIFEIEDCVLMQFTGVKDKKGVDVYEGDIIKSIHSDSDRSGRFFLEQKLPLSLNGVMTYNDRHAQFEIVMEKNSLNIVSTSIGWCHEDFEVIGNIFENPELLLKTPDLTSKETIDTIGNCANCGVEFHIHKEESLSTPTAVL